MIYAFFLLTPTVVLVMVQIVHSTISTTMHTTVGANPISTPTIRIISANPTLSTISMYNP